MAEIVAPTKSNLMKAKASLSLSRSGFLLLDKKRNVLIKEMMDLADKAKAIQNEIYIKIEDAYEALQLANLTNGIKDVEDVSYGIPADESFEILQKSVMGVDIPMIRYKKEGIVPSYGTFNTNIALDEARKQFNDLRYRIYDLAEIENSVYKLTKEIEKTNKRTNALEHIQIPKFLERVKHIQEVLEEKEREDFFRLKKVKKKIRHIS